MNIKSSQVLVEEAKKSIETLSSDEVKLLYENKEITLIDVRDIRELWKEGTIENSKHIPRGMLEFWLDPESPYYQSNKIEDIKKMVLFCALGLRSALATKSLVDMGYKNIAHVEGGFDALKKSGFKIEEINYLLASFKTNSILSWPQKILSFATNVGAPKMPFAYASLVFFLRLSFINDEAILNKNVFGLIFKFFNTFCITLSSFIFNPSRQIVLKMLSI